MESTSTEKLFNLEGMKFCCFLGYWNLWIASNCEQVCYLHMFTLTFIFLFKLIQEIDKN